MHHISNLELQALYQPNPGQTSQIFIQKCPSLSCYIQSFLASKLILCYVAYVSHLRTNIASQCFRLNCKLDASADVLLSESSHGSQTPSDLAALYESRERSHNLAASAAAIQNRNEGDHKEVTSTAAASTASSSYSLRR